MRVSVWEITFAASRNVAGSIPVEVIVFFNLRNPGFDSASNRNEYQECFWG
jgi:hypothetical protein